MKTSKFKINEDYFIKLTQNSAYILGFVLGDGCIRKNDSGTYTLSISINEKDRSVLDFALNEISPGRTLNSFYKVKQKSGKISNMCRVKWTSNKLCRGLLKQGIIPRKTGKEKWPSLKQSMYPHFLRGFFDADGCLSHKNKNEYVLTYTCANKAILLKIKKYFGVGKIYKGHGRCYTYSVSKRNQIEKICNILYNKASFYLERKRLIYNKMPKLKTFSAFGETKTLKEWSKDKRCKIGYDGLKYRIKKTNLSFEKCLIIDKYSKIGNMYSKNKPTQPYSRYERNNDNSNSSSGLNSFK